MNKYIIPATLIGTGMVLIFIHIGRRREVKKVGKISEEFKKMDMAAAKKMAASKIPGPEYRQSFYEDHHPEPTNQPPIMIAEPKSRMKDSERRELIERVKAMSREELELVAEIIPVDLCLKRIDAELQKAKQFEKSIKSAMSGLAE